MYMEDQSRSDDDNNTVEPQAERSARDLGTAGGGTVPAAGNRPAAAANDTPEPGSLAAQASDASSGAKAQQGSHGTPSLGQSQTPGNQDSTFSNSDGNDTRVDPMTGRLPDQIKKRQSEESGAHQGTEN